MWQGFKTSIFLRYRAWKFRQATPEGGVIFWGRGIVVNGTDVRIGSGTTVNNYVIINSLTASVRIGKNVALSDRVYITTRSLDVKAWRQGSRAHTEAPVTIEDGAWIAAGAIILPGVTIGARAIVAAGAVVTNNVGSGTVVGGVPARPFRAS